MPTALAELHWQELAALVGMGGLAGFCAGLLGIGGGLVVVPGLLLLLSYHGYPPDVVPLMAAGTSLSLMVFTATGSALSHLRQGTVCLAVLRQLLPWVMAAELLGILLATVINARLLETLFGVLVLVMAVDLLRRSVQPAPSASPTIDHPMALNMAVGSAIGLKSGLFGVGGGALAIPYFNWLGLSPREVAGTTALLTWPVAVVGAIAYGLSPLPVDHALTGVAGSVYWLGVLVMIPATVLMAPLGAMLCRIFPQNQLRQVFGVFLLVVGTRILL
ncbi:MAG: hypothetical protein TQ37_03600 [Candidatus Synechococcus spongiarum 15L]|uniref:Probable membrane transporter protein n=2 Tax=Candidatus Synechococcus spongiarum TaxID=431041 RepID=A0A1T1D0Z5_9SYNE|nr:sulfite exporter TauE/SafE family protein [Candidatus Synechococcus spongiarum]KKZ13736.1 MAG: hypothetical protein TQ37_03600 [Candidatus Synechococcus spongiarum 15L]OOV34408.1 anion permease [Candidatus Synechococcus spongiarum LMB bulk15N]